MRAKGFSVISNKDESERILSAIGEK